jgi:KDO2-lipid IV(A) lauroyltransferase
MRWVVGESCAEGTARASLRNYLRYLIEFLRFPSLTREDIVRNVEVVGVEHLHDAMALGRGAVAIGFHIGNIDLGAAVLAMQGYPVQVVVDRFEPESLDRLIQGYRREKGLGLIPLEQAPRQALRTLRDKQVLALLIDKPSPGEGVVVDFFGGPIEVPVGAAVLAQRTGAPVVPCVVWRTGLGRFRAEVAPPIDPAEYPSRDPRPLTQAMAAVLEEWVRRDPAQWYPFRKMWLSPPGG